MVAYSKNYKTSPRSNAPVTKAITKYKNFKSKVTNTKRYVANNRNAIMTLSKQVKSLQLSKLGLYQKAYMGYEFDPDDIDTPASWFSNESPLLFVANNFLEHNVYRGFLATNKIPTVNSTGSFVRTVFGDPEAQNTSYWNLSNDDAVSKEAYRPISCNLQFNFTGQVSNTTKEQWFRIDVFKQKKVLTNTNQHHLSLPYNLYGLKNMASDDLNRNKFNKEYFQILQTKWVRMPKVDVNNSYHSVGCNINIPFPDKILKPDSVGTIDNNGMDVPKTFEGSIPLRDHIFVMISTNYNNNSTKMRVKKFISWRDQYGVAA